MDTIFNTEGCFYRALDDEPVFVLLARDPCFSEAVRYWVTLRQSLIGQGEKPLEDHAMLAEAITAAQTGHIWRRDATGPAVEDARWHTEKVPARSLVETDKIARLENRLLENAKQFLQYARNHFDKGGLDATIKGEVNWSAYLEICEVLDIQPQEKPALSKTTDSLKLPPEEWDEWKAKAMPLGNDFLLGPRHGSLWFSQWSKRKSGETEWSDLYRVQKSLQRDMLKAAFTDWTTHQHDKAEHLKSLMETPPAFEDTGSIDSTRYRKGGLAPQVTVDAATPEDVLESFRERSPEQFAKFMASQEEMLDVCPAKAESDTIDVTDTPKMPPHRFTTFTKARGWAYGRGLEINPSHIPDMLDRMDKDGWHLQCVFGGVEATKVGMLFRRYHDGGPITAPLSDRGRGLAL